MRVLFFRPVFVLKLKYFLAYEKKMSSTMFCIFKESAEILNISPDSVLMVVDESDLMEISIRQTSSFTFSPLHTQFSVMYGLFVCSFISKVLLYIFVETPDDLEPNEHELHSIGLPTLATDEKFH